MPLIPAAARPRVGGALALPDMIAVPPGTTDFDFAPALTLAETSIANVAPTAILDASSGYTIADVQNVTATGFELVWAQSGVGSVTLLFANGGSKTVEVTAQNSPPVPS